MAAQSKTEEDADATSAVDVDEALADSPLRSAEGISQWKGSDGVASPKPANPFQQDSNSRLHALIAARYEPSEASDAAGILSCVRGGATKY